MIHEVRVKDLAVARGGRRLFDGLRVEVAHGEAVSVLGSNGAGKTSLLRAIAGLLRPDAGSVEFFGAGGPIDAEDARAGGLHLVGHLDGLKTSRSAREELRFWSEWGGAHPTDLAETIRAFALESLLDLDVRVLSAGQRRRLALARLLAPRRSVWLLDEPMAPLDAARRTAFAEVMKSHLERGGIIFAAVHDPLPLPSRSLELAAP